MAVIKKQEKAFRPGSPCFYPASPQGGPSAEREGSWSGRGGELAAALRGGGTQGVGKHWRGRVQT